ncbi:Inorganic pyrophosphatase [Metarhizium anisopliae]|nr:Inorganic pyrophosphatase [Metarhizium anisopliae]
MYVLKLFQAVLVPLSAVGAVAQNNGSYTLREVGARNTVDWRVWLEKDGYPVSPWHDVPLYPDNKPGPVINFVVEIPRWTDGKIETQRNEPLNPLFHDTSKNKPRFVASFWPHKTYPFLYGSIPQTWENKNVKDNYTGLVGDNDPVDLFDVSSISPGYTGEVKQVKVLGGLAMIDYYKVARGKGLNPIIGNEYVNARTMNAKLAESHQHWSDLVLGKEDRGKISIWQTTNPRACKTYVKPEDATKKFGIPEKSNILPPAARPAPYDRWYYVDEKFTLITVPGDAIEVD